MFGLDKGASVGDKLSVQVHAVASQEAFLLATKIWGENARSMRSDDLAHKEFLRFAYAEPKCTVWLQRDQGRIDTFELVIRWEADKTHEVYVLASGQSAGNTQRALALLNSVLTSPSVVLTKTSKGDI